MQDNWTQLSNHWPTTVVFWRG